MPRYTLQSEVLLTTISPNLVWLNERTNYEGIKALIWGAVWFDYHICRLVQRDFGHRNTSPLTTPATLRPYEHDCAGILLGCYGEHGLSEGLKPPSAGSWINSEMRSIICGTYQMNILSSHIYHLTVGKSHHVGKSYLPPCLEFCGAVFLWMNLFFQGMKAFCEKRGFDNSYSMNSFNF